MGGTVTTQQRFWHRQDDGTETTASFRGAVGTPWSPLAADLDTPLRIRFELGTTGMDESAGSYNLYYDIDGGGYNAVTTGTTMVQLTSSAQSITDDDTTSEQMSGAQTFQAGRYDETGSSTNITILQDQETEVEYCYQFIGADISGGEVISFEVFRNTSALDAYPNIPASTMPTPPAGEIQQSHFRIRNEGGLQTINQNSDWAAAIDTDATLDYNTIDGGCLFGLRFELEEIASTPGNKTITPKLQYRVEAGSWNDMFDVSDGDTYIDPGSNTNFYGVIVVDKATITDGAVTTNILSGSAKGFTAGTGEHHATAASVSLNNQHTELEWRILIRHRFTDSDLSTVQQETTDGDEFEFRIVESDDTILDGTYVIPKVTINIPAGYIGGTGIETSQNFAYITIPDGTMYAPIEDCEFTANIVMLKSTDGGDSWLQQDGATILPQNDMESWSMAYDDTNKVIHCLHVGGAVHYLQWATKDHAVETPDNWIHIGVDPNFWSHELNASVDSLEQTAEMILRGTTLYAFYSDLSGTDQIFYRKKTDLTDTDNWGSETSIDTSGGSTDFTGVSCVLGPNSNLIHMFYVDYIAGVLYHRSLSTGDALGSRHTINSSGPTSSDGRHNMTNALSWHDGSNEYAVVGYTETGASPLYTQAVQDDTTVRTQRDASNSIQVLRNPTSVNARQPVASLAMDGTTLYAIYALDSDADIWYNTATGDGAFGTPTEHQDGVTCHAIRATIFTHSAGNGSAKVLAYIWDTQYNQDAASPKSGYTGTNRYDELQLAAGAVRRVFVTHV